jgi:hypothetical protein
MYRRGAAVASCHRCVWDRRNDATHSRTCVAGGAGGDRRCVRRRPTLKTGSSRARRRRRRRRCASTRRGTYFKVVDNPPANTTQNPETGDTILFRSELVSGTRKIGTDQGFCMLVEPPRATCAVTLFLPSGQIVFVDRLPLRHRPAIRLLDGRRHGRLPERARADHDHPARADALPLGTEDQAQLR